MVRSINGLGPAPFDVARRSRYISIVDIHKPDIHKPDIHRPDIHDAMAIKAKQNKRDPEAMLPLTPAVFHIMLALAGGESHGYSLMAQVDALTAGRVQLGPGTLYRSIQRMLVDELIEEIIDARGATTVDERRRNYR